MVHRSSLPVRIAYICTVLGIVAPIGLAASGWVGLSLGRGGYGGILSTVSFALFLALGLWRIWVVAADRSTLDSPQTKGLLLAARLVGLFLLYVGAVVFVLNVVGQPLIRALVTHRSEDGIEYYVAGMYLALLGGFGSLGLLLFEYSRIRSFEMGASLEDS